MINAAHLLKEERGEARLDALAEEGALLGVAPRHHLAAQLDLRCARGDDERNGMGEHWSHPIDGMHLAASLRWIS